MLNYPKIIQHRFHFILGGEAGITQKASGALPVCKATVVKQFEFFCDYKRNDIVLKTFLEHDQAANTTITILKGVDGFEPHMKIKNIIKGDF